MVPDQVRGIPLGPTDPEEVRQLITESGLPAACFRLPILSVAGLSEVEHARLVELFDCPGKKIAGSGRLDEVC
jgi:hypothetical protein